ncbi:MAG TPA: DNA polymerase III subunit gamma/tau [Verrucomicrobiae bacterium]|nr:DNA polymerase III subunit gamma/tau [Verrucomicrobiae bacterium]
MARALYRKYRAKTLQEIVGQQHIVTILSAALQQQRINHAFLFTGPRGVGKTSIARILAHEINQLPYTDETTHLDIIEIDAASNRRIDDIRDLRDKIHIAPVSARYKVYIIDEVHMLTGESFNALLKTLEEPPAHAIFILATTESHKLPATIISRTQRFHFRPVPVPEVVAHLQMIAQKEAISITDDALQLVAEHGDGSFRDSISLLDQLSAFGTKEITAEMVETTLGLAPKTDVIKLAQAVLANKLDTTVQLLRSIEQKGAAAVIITQQLIKYLASIIDSEKKAAPLIDKLLEVGKSTNPSAKLLATLAIAAGEATSVKNAAESAVAPLPTLSLPVQPPKQPKPRPAAKVITTEEKQIVNDPIQPETIQEVTTATIIENFNWEQVVEAVRAEHVSVYGVIKHASIEYTAEGTLRLYFAYALHRKKVDDQKYRALLVESITKLYGNCPPIETTLGHAPPKDETAASVAALMGGGEEVKVNE